MKFTFEDKHIKWGRMAFIVITCSMILFFAIFRFNELSDLFSVVSAILTPFIYGMVFAYLLCPIYNLCTRNFYRFLQSKLKKPRRALTLSKGFATFISMLVFFIVIIGIGWMIVPGLVDSIIHIAGILPTSANQFLDWVDDKTINYPFAQDTVEALVNRFTEGLVSYVEDKMIPSYMELATSISTGVYGVLIILKNFFVGIIICIYYLNSKELFAAQSKKLIGAVFSEKRAKGLLEGAAYTNKTFGGFINGKLLDSLIIGILCFIVMTIFGWEYPLLISCIIGLTNVIPFFGPFIGAIPSGLLILMVDPMQSVYFLIFILILQQFDGSILGPKILGDSTGLSSFWVMFAILVGGGLFGFVGMIVGIPLFAVFYTYFSKSINKRLDKRGLSTEIQDYTIDKYRIAKTKKNREEKKDGN